MTLHLIIVPGSPEEYTGVAQRGPTGTTLPVTEVDKPTKGTPENSQMGKGFPRVALPHRTSQERLDVRSSDVSPRTNLSPSPHQPYTTRFLDRYDVT